MIVVAGEVLVDAVVDADGEVTRRTLGGGPFNAAVAAGRQTGTGRVQFLSRISTSDWGEQALNRLQESHVDTALAQRGDEEMTVAWAHLDESGAASYVFDWEGRADSLVVDPGLLDGSIFCFGTCSMVFQPGAGVYEEMMRRQHDAGALVALDPNIRPAVIEAAGLTEDQYRQRFWSWLPVVDVVKLSDDDCQWLAPEDSLDQAVTRMLDAGVQAVVLTRGAEGLSVHTGSIDAEVPAPKVEVVDTIGAGDTVMGTLLVALYEADAHPKRVVGKLKHEQWQEILHRCATAAAITVSRAGANPPFQAELVP